MENSDIEIKRFSKKAASYRQALQTAPNSRVLEVAAIISTLEGYVKSNELDKKNLVIVDLMSGNGYLSNYLVQTGFKKIHAIEACNEMSENSDNYKNVELHPISNITETNSVLKEVAPDIIVSLASFHHLIVRNEDKTINHQSSVQLQSELISICVKNLSKDGILIIADLFDDSLLNVVDTYPDNKYWAKNAFKKIINGSFINQEVKIKINNSKSLDSYSKNLKNIIPNLSNQKNPSLNWFRNIVDKKTTLGHDDVALSKDLLVELSTKFSITADTFYCPWIFENENQLKTFLWYKFGFVNNETELTKQEEIIPLATSEVGINQHQDKEYYFGWALSILTVRDKASKENSYSKRLYLFQVVLLILIVFFYGIFRKFQYFHSDGLDKIIFTMIGILIKSAFDLIAPYLWKKN
jgi:predicted rRNA methylase YqxC with S4 and FtsJ domains